MRVMIDREGENAAIRNAYGTPEWNMREAERYMAAYFANPARPKGNAERLAEAQSQAAAIRARNFPAPCQCAGCVQERNLPGVLRVIEQYQQRSAA